LHRKKDERIMKTQSSYHSSETNAMIGAPGLRHYENLLYRSLASHYSQKYPAPANPAPGSDLGSHNLLTDEATAEIASGGIPDLGQVCLDLYRTFLKPGASYSAVQFIPILKELRNIDPSEVRRFIKNPVTRHVLVNNALLKVVLIHWKPGIFTSVHGHARGGCVFKVLKGSLEEKRYSTDESQRLMAVSTLQSGSMAYIDDNMAYHAVGNPAGTSAISLHIYTPGGK
jgi:hypothetical protein